MNDKNQFSRKENVPIEAVYAYIEAKHTLTKESLTKAKNQIREVKNLVNLRNKVPLGSIDNVLPTLNNVGVNEWYPEYRNPVFTAIISKNVKIENEIKTDLNEVEQFLNENKPDFREKNNPDLILGNKNNGLRPFCEMFSENSPSQKRPTVFLLDDLKYNYQSVKHENLTFGLGFIHLLSALNWIKLGLMPYNSLLDDAMINK